jgi:hypothetical protein
VGGWVGWVYYARERDVYGILSVQSIYFQQQLLSSPLLFSSALSAKGGVLSMRRSPLAAHLVVVSATSRICFVVCEMSEDGDG